MDNCKDYWEYRGGISYEYKGETFYTVTPIPYYYRRRALLVNLLSLVVDGPNAVRICDFGCGDGWYLKYLAERHEEKQWYGVDMSESMIARARQACPMAEFHVSHNGIEVNRTFDLVYSVAVFAHVLDDVEVRDLFKSIATRGAKRALRAL